MSSILHVTISSGKIFANNLSKDNITKQEFSPDNYSGKSIYKEDDIIRSGNTLFVNDTWLFLIENWYDLEIYNISNVNEPKVVNNSTGLSVSYDSKMIVQNNTIYIYCEDTDILHVLDITNPMFISERTRYTELEDLENFAVNDWYLYTISENNFTIYNFENFTALVQLDNYYNNTNSYHDFTIKGNYSYVLDERKGFAILNITDHSNIQYIDEIVVNDGEYKSTIYIKNDNLFLFDCQNGLYSYDISNPLVISQISLYELANYIIRDICVNENIMFLLESDGLFILNASNLEQIQSISNYTATDYHTIFESFMIQNNLAYLQDTFTGHFEPRTPLYIVNVTNLESPYQIFPIEEENFWEWLERILNTMLAIAIVIMVLPPLFVATIIILVIHFYRKKKKPIDEIKNVEQ